MKKQNIYELITNEIIDLLEKVQSGDVTHWLPLSGLAYNPVSKHTYNSLNQLLLSIRMYKRDYHVNHWMTYNQIHKSGGAVIKGEKSSIVTFSSAVYYDKNGQRLETEYVYSLLKKAKKNNSSISSFKDIGITQKWFLKMYNVFNLKQTENVDARILETHLKGLDDVERFDFAEQIIEDTGAKIIHVDANSAHYNKGLDKIQMPNRKQFNSSEDYYATLFHELIHWSGHEDRMNRNLSKTFGDQEYAFEELIAELGSAFICAKLNINASIKSSAAYIKSWLNALESDKKYIMKAFSYSEKAMKYITDKQLTSA